MNSVKSRFGPQVKILDEPLKSIADFENWKYSVLYNLRLDTEVRPYVIEDLNFGAKTSDTPNRNLRADTGENGKSAVEKCVIVDFMLDTIAQYCPKIPHNDIVLECGSLLQVWQVVRLHSNIQTSGALLNEIWNITRLPNETPQALYSRIKQAYDDNLIRANSIRYRDNPLTADETLSPTLHCTIILHWLQILHPKLRDLVTQKFCTELRNVSYAAIWPEISRSVDRYLKELQDDHDGTVCRIGDNSRYGDSYKFASNFRPPQRARGSNSRFRGTFNRSTPPSKSCDYCRITGRRAAHTHSIDDCLFLKKERQQSEGFSRAVEEEIDEQYSEYYEAYPEELNQIVTDHIINQVSVNSSPVLTLYISKKPYDITLDSGGTCNVIDTYTAEELRCKIRPSFQGARLGDGKTRLKVTGETDIDFQRHGQVYRLSALVAEMADPTILGGIPFFIANDIGIRPALSEISLNLSQEVIKYDPSKVSMNKFRRLQSFLIRSPCDQVILPGEEMSFCVPEYLHMGKSVAVEPRFDNSHNLSESSVWPTPEVHDVKEGQLNLMNTSNSPLSIKKNAHICNLQTPMYGCEEVEVPISSISQVIPSKKIADYSGPVQVNPDKVLSDEVAANFASLLKVYDEVFNPTISKYNGKSGACFVEVNMGPQPPPQHKGRIPNYGRGDMQELQLKMDELYDRGVFRRPQDIGVTVEVVNPSFLVKKKSSNDKRLVTDFGQIASYCRPTPTVMPDVESTLRRIASWDVIIKADLKDAYWQLELRKSSMKYCGVVSPMKGVMVYTVGCMGLPGTEVALEELTCLLFGHLVMQGKVAKLADDLFIGAKSVEELLRNFEEVLQILQENNLRLSAKKTVICPKSCVILGWIWSEGHLKAGPHRLSALSECEPPATVKGLKSFIGAYRFLSRVIKNYASLLLPLEMMISGKVAMNSKLEWSADQRNAFKVSQTALKNSKSVVLPKPEDALQIVTDAALLPSAVGAVLYAIRDGKPMIAGYYNSKLPAFQRKWLPCELEGVAIGVALNHFAPYLIQSEHRPSVLTDSKACVQAVEKLNRGEYSTSARLCTFLSSVSRYQASVKHIQGSANHLSDYISRNPVTCKEDKCQICNFIKTRMESVVAAVSVDEVLSGKVSLPFVNKRAWREIQEECPDLRHVVKYLRNGTTPGKKGRNLRQVKRYITAKVVISAEGTLVIRQIEPYSTSSERIVVPQQVLHGILTMLHIKLSHPSGMQLTKVFNRYFYALNLDKAITQNTQSCHQCVSLKEVPNALREESSDPPPDHFAQTFAGDVIKRNSQLILVLRECTSSYTQAELIPSEKAVDISAGLLRLSNLMRPSKLVSMSIRLDPHPSHKSIFKQISNDKEFGVHNIQIDIGRELNINHNPVAEKAVRELIREILKLRPDGGAISSTELSQAIAVLNSRLRSPGLSAYEVFTQRDQTSGKQLSVDDKKLIRDQQERRRSNHKYSEKSKSSKPPHPPVAAVVGDIVYVYGDKSKLAARPRYFVVSISDGSCKLKRFSDKRLSPDTYSVKLADCYKVPDEFCDVTLPPYPREFEESEDQGGIEYLEPAQEEVQPVHQEEELASDDEPDLADPCSSCKMNIEEEAEALSCDTCLRWCHITCGGVEPETYQYLIDHAEDEVRWMCPSCINQAVDPKTIPHTAILPGKD